MLAWHGCARYIISASIPCFYSVVLTPSFSFSWACAWRVDAATNSGTSFCVEGDSVRLTIWCRTVGWCGRRRRELTGRQGRDIILSLGRRGGWKEGRRKAEDGRTSSRHSASEKHAELSHPAVFRWEGQKEKRQSLPFSDILQHLSLPSVFCPTYHLDSHSHRAGLYGGQGMRVVRFWFSLFYSTSASTKRDRLVYRGAYLFGSPNH